MPTSVQKKNSKVFKLKDICSKRKRGKKCGSLMPLSTLKQDLCFLQQSDIKRRYQQFVLSYCLGFTRSTNEIPNEEKILQIRSFLEFCKNTLVDLGDSTNAIPSPILHATADIEGLLHFSGQAVLLEHLEPCDYTRKKIIDKYESLLSRSRNLWKNLDNADLMIIKHYVDRAKQDFTSKLSRFRKSSNLASPMPPINQPINTNADQQIPDVRTSHLEPTRVVITPSVSPQVSDNSHNIQEQMLSIHDPPDESAQIHQNPLSPSQFPVLTSEQADAAFALFWEEQQFS